MKYLKKPSPLYNFTIEVSKNKEFFWRCVHKNGNEICRSSETYKNKTGCKKSIQNFLKGVQAGKYGLL